jgi:SAM-dependent methyltransferase
MASGFEEDLVSVEDRLRSESTFHDRQAEERGARFLDPARLRFEDATWLDHETWVRPALARLGPLAGRRLLDFGCGHGMSSVVLARAGARVTAFDLSGGYLEEARRRAAANDVAIDFVRADGARLPFADAVFDAIWGNAVLHHLDLTDAARGLWRVLRPGGVAVFCEPWGDNPFLALARRWLPYPGKQRTPDEQPLRSRDLPALRRVFPDLECEGWQLLAMARRVLPPGRLVQGLERTDAVLLRRLPGLRRFARYAILALRRPG